MKKYLPDSQAIALIVETNDAESAHCILAELQHTLSGLMLHPKFARERNLVSGIFSEAFTAFHDAGLVSDMIPVFVPQIQHVH